MIRILLLSSLLAVGACRSGSTASKTPPSHDGAAGMRADGGDVGAGASAGDTGSGASAGDGGRSSGGDTGEGANAGGGAEPGGGGTPGDPTEEAVIDAARIHASIATFVDLGPAAEGHESKDRVREWIVDTLRESSAKVQVLGFTEQTPAGPWQLENLLASFRPDARHRVFVGAHWDTRLWAEKDADPSRRDQPITGANDGGSGVAVLLELARVLSLEPPPEGVGVDLLFFDGEEGFAGDLQEWLYGSRELAERWFTTGLAVPKEGVIVDMVAKKGTQVRRERVSQANAFRVLDEIFAIAKRKGYQSFVDELGITIYDDHIPFNQRGIPTALLIDLDYEHWHTHQDTLDKVDPRPAAEVGDVVLEWIRTRKPPAP